MSAGPDRFDIAQFAADAAEWDELGRSGDSMEENLGRWRDLRGELAEAAAQAAAHMAHQAEQIAELRRRLEEERVGRASSRRHLQGQLDWALAEIKRLQAAAGAAPVPDAVLEERARQLSESLDVELEHVRHLEARQQALLATIAALGATTPYPEELAGWEGQRAKMIAEVGTLRAAAKALPEWRADSERLRAERAQVREVMGASPAEGHIEAARRVVGERDRLCSEAERIAGTSLGAMRREVAQLRERVAALMAELTKWQRRAEEARAEATSSLVTGFCAELARALELPAGSAMDDIAAEVSRLAGGGWLEMRHEVERLRDFGLEAARIAARAEVTRSDILRAEDLIAEIERKP